MAMPTVHTALNAPLSVPSAVLMMMICPPKARLHLPVYHVKSVIGDSQLSAVQFSLASHIH